MAGRNETSGKGAWSPRRGLAAWAWLALIVPSASCVPAGLSAPAGFAAASAAAQPLPARIQPIETATAGDAAAPGFLGLFNPAFAVNAAIPVASGPNPGLGAYVFRAATPLDRMRSLDCLAQAVYYEARSESEDGQRAVAQVVLNRVRHPSWPDSVCGVVYQGPLRTGGGCQFTFTCDGSLAFRPSGPGWDRARRIAAEALGGRIYPGIGTSTHYHTSAVFPAWAPRLVKTAVIGAHNFYRLPGLGGAPGAFGDAYAGTEPMPRPSSYMAAARQASASPANVVPAFDPASIPVHRNAVPPSVVPPSDIPQDARWTANDLPQSTVREEYRQSGQWREDAPASVSGAR